MVRFAQRRHSGPVLQRGKLQPESRVPGENRDPFFEMVPDFGRDDAWMPPYQSKGQALQVRHDGKRYLSTDSK
jgi:hypothetical protein